MNLKTIFCGIVISGVVHAAQLPEHQTKYLCQSINQESANQLEFILSYEATIGLEELKITQINGKAVYKLGNEALLHDRYIMPNRNIINFQYLRNETGENLVTLESVASSVVAPDGKFNKFNAVIAINDGAFLEYSCKDQDLF